MRCPRCHHITNVGRHRCPSCGQDLSPASELPPSVLDLPNRSEPLGPLADLELDHARKTPAGAVGRARSTRPLSVRRPTPRVPKLRTAEDRSNAAAPALEFETAAVADPGADAPRNRIADGVSAALLGRRAGAAACDLLLLAAVDATVVALTVRLTGLELGAVDALPLIPLAAFLLLLDVGYMVALTALGGQTIGKMVTGVRVVAVEGTPVTIGAAAIRAAAYTVSVLPAGLGMLGLFFGSRRSLHDHLADTRVVKA